MALNRIQAIRVLRETAGLSLKHAKEIVDTHWHIQVPTELGIRLHESLHQWSGVRISQKATREMAKLFIQGNRSDIDVYLQRFEQGLYNGGLAKEADLEHYVDKAYEALIIGGRGDSDPRRVAQQALAHGQHMVQVMNDFYEQQAEKERE